MIYRFNDNKESNAIILEPITKEEEQAIDDTKVYSKLKNKNELINIKEDDIYFYGEIDINKEEDAAIIMKYRIVDRDLIHSWVPTNFNYKTGYGLTTKAPTTNSLLWFKYCHCRIGKPKYIICYKIKYKLL